MVEFLRIQYRLKRITEDDLDNLISKGTINLENKIYIMS